MYTEENRGFTIITDFGCDKNCPYCITRLHPILNGARTNLEKLDWEYLEQCISETDAPTINLSGGGDPLFIWERRIPFYLRLYRLASKYDKQLDVHTRILPEDVVFTSLFRKFAITLEYTSPKALLEFRMWLHDVGKDSTAKFRVVQVVDSKITEQDIEQYVRFLNDSGIEEITFRQMFGNKEAGEHYQELKKKLDGVYEGVMFLDDGEHHNYYFTTDNKLYPYFFGHSEQDRLRFKKLYEDKEQSCN